MKRALVSAVRLEKRKGHVVVPFAFGSRVLLAQTARDVAEHVLDLVAKNNQNYDDHDRDQDEDKGVLDHTLPFLTVEQCAQTQVEAVQHGFHLPSERLRPVWHRPRINGSRAETENATAWSRVGKSWATSPLNSVDESAAEAAALQRS